MSQVEVDPTDPRQQTRTIELDANLAYLLGVLIGDGHFEQGAQAPLL